MDPYLEAPDIWPDFHQAMAVKVSATLNGLLPGRYFARLQARPESGLMPDRVSIYDDPLQHHYVEIRDAAQGHKLVTLIEIVSPSNKHSGPDRRAYESKQKEVLSSDAHLIELDFLRRGRRLLPYPDLELAVDSLAADYLVLLNRGSLRQGNWMDYTLYPVRLREPLPCIPVPLSGPDEDVLLDLQIAVNQVYRTGPYARAVDYSSEPDPPLSEDDQAWAAERLQAAGLRD